MKVKIFFITLTRHTHIQIARHVSTVYCALIESMKPAMIIAELTCILKIKRFQC